MWNPFKKGKEKASQFALNMASRIAMKKAAKMGPREREKMMREAFDPKNKDKMLAVMEHMKNSGQITDEQYKIAKQKLGL